MRSSVPTLEICTVALWAPSLNCSCTVPDGTPVSSNRPNTSTDADRFVPVTVTTIPEAGAVAPVAPTVIDAEDDAGLLALTVPTIVAPPIPAPDPSDEDGAVTPPPHAATAKNER